MCFTCPFGHVPSLEREHDVGVEFQASVPPEEAPSGVNVSEITNLFLFAGSAESRCKLDRALCSAAST